MDALRWVFVLLAVLFVIGLAAYAGGPKHYRGDDVGTHGTKIVLVRADDE